MVAHEFSLPASLRYPLRCGVGLYVMFIIWASLRPAGTGVTIPHFDKIMHLLVYALLAIAVLLAWPKFSKVKVFWVCAIFGGAIEIAQGLSATGRTASLLDGLANGLGAALGVYIAAFAMSKFAR